MRVVWIGFLTLILHRTNEVSSKFVDTHFENMPRYWCVQDCILFRLVFGTDVLVP